MPPVHLPGETARQYPQMSVFGNANLTVGIGGEQAVLGQHRATDHTVQPNFAARRRGEAELRAGEEFRFTKTIF